MNVFKRYESFLYQIDKSLEDIDRNNTNRASSRIKESYIKIKGSPVSNLTDIRQYVESAVGAIERGEYERAKESIYNLRNEVSEYQDYLISYHKQKNR